VIVSHLFDPMVTRAKLDGKLGCSDKTRLLAVMRPSADDGCQGCRLVECAVRAAPHDVGPLGLPPRHAAATPDGRSIGAPPRFDVVEPREAMLSDREILRLLRDGMRAFRAGVDDADRVDLARARFVRAARQVGSLGAWGYRDWRRDIVEGDSGWEVFWDAVKVGGGAVIVGANLAGAVETLGATIVSVASGAALVADGMRDIDKDVDDATGIRR
jgi:hypothetical protein